MQSTKTHRGPDRVMLYSHDSVGLGHTRRNRELAHAISAGLPKLTGRPVTGLLASSIDGHSDELPSGFDWVRLPGIRKEKRHYRARQLRLSFDSVVDLRSAVLEAAVGQLRPDLLIVDRHPFGVGGELLPALRRMRAEHPSCRIVLGLRDVLDARQAMATEWRVLRQTASLSEFIDAVWVYGDPTVHDLCLDGEVPAELAEKISYTGFLSQGRRRAESAQRRPFVLTTVGGGADGHELCLAAAQASPPPGHEHVVVTGPQMPESAREQIRRAAGPHTRVLDSVPDAHALIARASAVITMAGYNTACEILNTAVPALLVPRERPRAEQRIRAEALAACGAADLLPVDQLHPQRITEWLAGAVSGRVDRSAISLDGLHTVVEHAARLLEPTRLNQGGHDVAV